MRILKEEVLLKIDEAFKIYFMAIMLSFYFRFFCWKYRRIFAEYESASTENLYEKRWVGGCDMIHYFYDGLIC